MLKIGVLGAGHLGKIHIKCILMSDQYELVGFHDLDSKSSKIFAEENNITYYENVDDLISKVDVIDIVTPTVAHYNCAYKALKSFKHVFIEKPITNTIEEANSLLALTKEADVNFQVGHVERFNPAFTKVKHQITSPMFIETHRLAEFNPRGTDVSVVLDLMIHDLDIVLSTVKSSVKNISASGVAVVSDTPDIANARIEFNNGCVANLTASRMSLKNMRKSRFFQKDAYITVDFLTKTSEVISMETINGEPGDYDIVMDLGEKGKKKIIFDKPDIEANNAIKDELEAFAESINKKTTPIVSIEDGVSALTVAHQIMEKININKIIKV
jgi:predicted dehydrogenase